MRRKGAILCGLQIEVMLTNNAEIMVATDAPMKPSHVFFGDSLIKGVLPKKKPKI